MRSNEEGDRRKMTRLRNGSVGREVKRGGEGVREKSGGRTCTCKRGQ